MDIQASAAGAHFRPRPARPRSSCGRCNADAQPGAPDPAPALQHKPLISIKKTIFADCHAAATIHSYSDAVNKYAPMALTSLLRNNHPKPTFITNDEEYE
jgi:hypothetical protein